MNDTEFSGTFSEPQEPAETHPELIAPEVEQPTGSRPVYRGTANDPLFGYAIAMALSFGLIPLLPRALDLRYTLAWGSLAIFGVVAWLIGNGERIGQEKPENLVWGSVIGGSVGFLLYIFGGQTLTATVNLLFSGLSPGALLAYLVFVMPLGETLFFRGIMQQARGIWVVAVQATLWNAVLFLPPIFVAADVGSVWVVVIFIVVALAIVNVVYSWIRERNGLAAAWLCQIVVNLILIFLPFVS